MRPSRVIRYGAYPLVFGGSAAAILALTTHRAAPWPGLVLVVLIGVGMVALLERLQPYERAWLRDHDDGTADALHVLVNFGLLSLTAWLLHVIADWMPGPRPWPLRWPVWSQVLLAGAIVDAGLYGMHRSSHRVRWLWRLHAIHHSAERLYWMNGERRHPLSAVVLAAPGIAAVAWAGAPPVIASAWLAVLAVHLAFQHANVDYSLGPFRHWLGVAETHRWHHKREYEDAQVNFGEFFMLWDRAFGTYARPPGAVRAGEVGLREAEVPTAYAAQLLWPFGIATPRDGA